MADYTREEFIAKLDEYASAKKAQELLLEEQEEYEGHSEEDETNNMIESTS